MSETTENVVSNIDTVSDTKLRKDAVRLPEVLFQSITSMAPAAAVATSFTPAIPLAGASLPLAVLLATIASALIALSVGQLAVHIPSAGGLYTYISRSLGPKLGFMSAWAFLFGQPLLLPLVAVIWGPYAEDLVKSLTNIDIPWYIWAVLGSLLVFALTYNGVRISTRASVILGSIEIVIIGALAITMIIGAGSHNNLATFTPAFSPGGWGGIFQGMIFAFLVFVDFTASATLGEESRTPKRTIPRAIVYSTILIGLFYMLTAYAGVVGWGIPGIQGYAASAAPWGDLGKKFWGDFGPLIISFAVLNSAVGNGNADLNSSSRVMYAMGRVGALPAVFARLTRRRTPGFAIIVHSIVGVVISIGCGLIFGLTNAYGLIATVLTLAILLLYFASCVSSFVYYRRERPQDFRIVQHVIVPLIPMIILLFVFAAQIYPVPPYPLNLALPIVVVWLVLGVIYMLYLNRKNPAALEHGRDVYLNDSEAEPTSLANSLL